MPLPTFHQNSVGISGSLVHLDVCTKVAWDDSHPGGSISVVLLSLWRTSARVNRRVGFARQWDEASARLWSHVEFRRCIRLIDLQISALSGSRYEIWGPSEGHAVKRHDLASFASHLSYLPVLEMTNSSAAMLSPSSLRNGRKHPAQAAVLSLTVSCLSRASASKGDGADFLFFFSFFFGGISTLTSNRSTFAALEHRTERIRKPASVDSLFVKSPPEPE